MDRILNYLPVLTAVVGGWVVANGVLHDIFVMLQGKPYDRNALRLYMDGHILITCGALQLIAYSGLKIESTWAFYIAGIACLSLLIYCMMIFPFLKSFGTIFLNTLLLGFLIFAFMKR